MKKKTIYAVILSLVLLICIATVYFSTRHELEYTLVYSYAMPEKSTAIWKVVSDTGFWTKEMYASEYKSTIGSSFPEEILSSTCSYVTCYGYTLERLYYTEGEMSGRFTSENPYYYVHATIRADTNNEINVYRVKNQIRIDRDPHTNAGDDTVILQ